MALCRPSRLQRRTLGPGWWPPGALILGRPTSISVAVLAAVVGALVIGARARTRPPTRGRRARPGVFGRVAGRGGAGADPARRGARLPGAVMVRQRRRRSAAPSRSRPTRGSPSGSGTGWTPTTKNVLDTQRYPGIQDYLAHGRRPASGPPSGPFEFQDHAVSEAATPCFAGMAFHAIAADPVAVSAELCRCRNRASRLDHHVQTAKTDVAASLCWVTRLVVIVVGAFGLILLVVAAARPHVVLALTGFRHLEGAHVSVAVLWRGLLNTRLLIPAVARSSPTDGGESRRRPSVRLANDPAPRNGRRPGSDAQNPARWVVYCSAWTGMPTRPVPSACRLKAAAPAGAPGTLTSTTCWPSVLGGVRRELFKGGARHPPEPDAGDRFRLALAVPSSVAADPPAAWPRCRRCHWPRSPPAEGTSTFHAGPGRPRGGGSRSTRDIARPAARRHLHSLSAAGHPAMTIRDGYRVVRRSGSMVFLGPRPSLRLRTRRGDGLVEIWNGMPFFSPLWARCPSIVLLHHVHAEIRGGWCLAGRSSLGPARSSGFGIAGGVPPVRSRSRCRGRPRRRSSSCSGILAGRWIKRSSCLGSTPAFQPGAWSWADHPRWWSGSAGSYPVKRVATS